MPHVKFNEAGHCGGLFHGWQDREMSSAGDERGGCVSLKIQQPGQIGVVQL